MEKQEKASLLKRLAVVLFAALLSMSMFALVGCNTDDTSSDDSEASDTESTEEVSPGEETNGTDPVVDPVDPDDPGVYVKGSVTDDVYASEWLDLRFEIPSGYRAMTDEEIAAAQGVGADSLGVDVSDVEAAAAGVVIETMITETTVGRPNFSLSVEKLPAGISSTSDYIEAFTPQLESLGFTVGGDGQETIAGQEFDYVSASISVSGTELIQSYFFRVQGDYIVYFTVTYTADTQTAAEELIYGFEQF